MKRLYALVWVVALWSTAACYVGICLADMAWPRIRIRSRYPLCEGAAHPPVYQWRARVG